MSLVERTKLPTSILAFGPTCIPAGLTRTNIPLQLRRPNISLASLPITLLKNWELTDGKTTKTDSLLRISNDEKFTILLSVALIVIVSGEVYSTSTVPETISSIEGRGYPH